MCITSAKAKLSKTRIMSLALDNGRHLLSYSNKVKNTSGKTNSMILAVPGNLHRKWFKDTTKYNKFLEEIEQQAYAPLVEMRSASKGLDRSLSFDQFTVGMYNIVITDDISDIYGHGGNDLFPNGDTPEISEELVNFFQTQYKGWSFLVCVFSGDKEMDSQPIMFEYEPIHKDWLYFPTMDSHTGGAPDLTEKVNMDHSIIIEHSGVPESQLRNVKFSQKVPEKLKRRKFVSTKWKEQQPNGDMYIRVSDLSKSVDYRNDSYRMFKRSIVHPGTLVPA